MVSLKATDRVVQMVEVYEVQLDDCCKCLEAKFSFEGVEVSAAIKKALENWNDRAHWEIVICVAILLNCLADVLRADETDAPATDSEFG